MTSGRKNWDYLALDLDAEGSHIWQYFIDSPEDTVSEVTEGMISSAKRLYNCWDRIAKPVSVDIAFYEFDDEISQEMAIQTHDNKQKHWTEISDPEGVKWADLRSHIESVINERAYVYLQEIRFDIGFNFTLSEGQIFITGQNNDYYKRVHDGEILDSKDEVPISVDLVHIEPDYVGGLERFDDGDSLYNIRFQTYVEIWFEDTEVGLANREKLHQFLSCVEKEFDVREYRCRSKMFLMPEMDERFFVGERPMDELLEMIRTGQFEN